MNVLASFRFKIEDQPSLRFEREFDLPWVPTRGSYVSTDDFRWRVRSVEFVVDETPLAEVHLESMSAGRDIWRVTALDLIDDGWRCELSAKEILEEQPTDPGLQYLIENPFNPAG